MIKEYISALKKLVEKECEIVQKRVEMYSGKRFALFPAGQVSQMFYHVLLDEFGIEAELFFDNNKDLEGKLIQGKAVKSIDDLEVDLSRYVILIPTSYQNYHQIITQIKSIGFDDFVHAEAFCASHFFDKYSNVADMLADDESKLAYWGAIYSLMTGDNEFVQYEGGTYFALREFTKINNDIVVDAGAYVGDTLEEYVKRGMGGVKVYSFEPFEEAREKLTARAKRLIQEWDTSEREIVIIPAGVGAETKTVRFAKTNMMMIKPDESGDMTLQIYSLDDYFRDIPPFTILKADIEGGELDMLRGATGLVSKNKPRMALSIYHSALDFFRIAEYVRHLVPEYRIYVRSHYYDHTETVLYCLI